MRPLASAVSLVVQVYSFILLVRVLLGWFGFDPYHPLSQFIFRLTEPVLDPIRRILPPTGAIDFSPLAAMILLMLVGQLIVALITG